MTYTQMSDFYPQFWTGTAIAGQSLISVPPSIGFAIQFSKVGTFQASITFASAHAGIGELVFRLV
jgi:hypothetical protein